MKIGIIAFPYEGGKSGLWNHIKNIVEKITEIDQENEYYIFTHYDFKIRRKNVEQLLFKSNLINHPIINILWHRVYLPYAVKKLKIDLLHLPAGNRRLIFSKPCKVIATIHDIVPKYGILRAFYTKTILPLAIKNLDKVICVSKSTEKDVIEKWNVDKSITEILPNGIDLDLYNVLNKEISRGFVSEKYNISGKFIFYVSRLEHPGKNQVGLIKAFSKLKEEYGIPYRLVFAGSNWNGAKYIYRAAKKSRFSEDIIFLGFVPPEDLPYFYNTCDLFVFPSLYEGFGIPILEAFAAGAPVVCSNTSSMPEVLGDCGLVFNPTDPDDIAKKIHMMLNDSALREQCIRKGRERAKLFDWKNIARKTITIYESV